MHFIVKSIYSLEAMNNFLQFFAFIPLAKSNRISIFMF